MSADESSELTAFQIEVARMFFGLPESSGFVLAGGAALLAQHLTHRPTQDLDFFTGRTDDVQSAASAFETGAKQRGWGIVRIQNADSFCRLTVTNDEAVLVDLALDTPSQLPPTASFLGPTFAPEELAARKILALFDRAEARDFSDVYVLACTFDRDIMLERAASLDLGLTRALLADSMATHTRFRDEDIPIAPEELAALRDFFNKWCLHLRT